MANLNDLSTFLKRDDIQEGDTLVFVNEGEIKDVDFSKTKDGKDMKQVFQITVELPDGREKVMTVNKASQNSLSEKYSKDTAAWKGKQATVSFVKQLAFGKMTDVLVLLPVE